MARMRYADQAHGQLYVVREIIEIDNNGRALSTDNAHSLSLADAAGAACRAGTFAHCVLPSQLQQSRQHRLSSIQQRPTRSKSLHLTIFDQLKELED